MMQRPGIEVENDHVVSMTDDGFADFGKAAYGWIEAFVLDEAVGRMTRVALGEVRAKPARGESSVRFAEVDFTPSRPGWVRVETPRDARNTGGAAVVLPEEYGVVMPIRYAKAPFPLRRRSLHWTFDDAAAAFDCSDPALTAVWELCRYSIKATSAFGYYIDGDRERIPYEADAYINQLSHYAVDSDWLLARRTHDHLMANPTWPREWKQHSIMMQYADWMRTGKTDSVAKWYDALKSEKLMRDEARPSDGLLGKGCWRDIVDWPEGERDGFEFKDVNCVVNAFYCRNLREMSEMAGAIGRKEDAADFAAEYARVSESFNRVFFDPVRGAYRDGEGADHFSAHASAAALACGLVPGRERRRVAQSLASRGMAVSTYFAQYLLEALFAGGEDKAATRLMVSDTKRSWLNMIRCGSTITTEAWDDSFKPNQDWNHAWATAPVNIIARYVLGVRTLEPGDKTIFVDPRLGHLQWVRGTVPTLRGPVCVSATNGSVNVSAPEGVKVVQPTMQLRKA